MNIGYMNCVYCSVSHSIEVLRRKKKEVVW